VYQGEVVAAAPGMAPPRPRAAQAPQPVSVSEIAMKELVICWSVGTSSAQAIACLSAPNQAESGAWSWREIYGRKCWYKKGRRGAAKIGVYLV
jgi:hypothetical protein